MSINEKVSRSIERTRRPNCGQPLSKVVGCDMSGEVSTVTAPSEAEIGISDRSDAIVRGLTFVLAHHGAPNRVLCDLKQQVKAYLDNSEGEGIWMKRTKYVLTYPLAKFLRNELPPSPDVVFAPSGPLRRWMKARMNAFNRKNVHLWYSWLQAKRCALSVSDDMIDEAYKKHYAQLTKPDPCLSEEDEEHPELERMFSNPVFRHVLNSIRNKIWRTFVPNFHERVASTSACFENSRSKKGQYGELRNFLESIPSDTFALDDPNLIKEEKKDYPSEEFESLEAVQVEEKDYAPQDQPECIPVRARGDEFTPFIGGDELIKMYQVIAVRGKTTHEIQEQRERAGRYRWKMLKEIENYRLTTQSANLYATIQAVLEPLKIRIISKGPAFEYYQMKPLQKAIHSAMRDMPCFRLIGRKICPTDLIDLIPDEIGNKEWISVDYSAATDGLSSKLGLKILDYLTMYLSPEVRVTASKVLGPHDLYYPSRKGKKWGIPQYEGLQTNGQLMGGILSFPILCLANLAVYLRVKNSENLDDLKKVLVNGDDMLYVGSKAEWDRHVRIAGSVGLEMSVGKAYKHRSYANANSTSFVCDLSKGCRTPWQINYLNAGLVFGQHKVQKREAGTAESHHKDSESCVSNIPAILDGSLPSKQCDLLRYVLETRSEEINEETKCILRFSKRTSLHHRNLFLPTALGGMGVEAPVGWKYVIKPVDRRLALSRVLAIDANLECRPTLGFELEAEVDPIPPWVAKVPESEIPEFAMIPGKLRRIPVGVLLRTYSHRNARLC